jgi:Tol biopolymer transport system component
MGESDELLLKVALSVADGKPVDWAGGDLAADEEAQRLLGRLAQLEALSRLHPSIDATGAANFDRPLSTPTDREFRRWGALDVLDHVGGGSYGDVYRARDSRLARDVALKLLHYEEQPERSETALVREAHLLARVRHPNVVTVYGAERIGGRTGLWMEFIEGETLEEELRRRGPLPPDEVARIGISLTAALGAVHGAGLVHRDVKAQNVMRERSGRLVLMDFGAGHEAGYAHDQKGLAGTPAYLAPELLAGGSAGVSTDLYALGVVLFRLATGRFPVQGDTLEEIKDAHRRGARESLAAIDPAFPPALSSAVDCALSPDPSARYQHATEMEGALQRAVDPARPGRRVLYVGVAVLSIVTAAVVFWQWQSSHRRARAGDVQQRVVWRAPDAGAIYMGSVSADGRYVSSSDFDARSLIVRDVQAGTTRVIVPPAGPDMAEQSILSRDGTLVAYAWAVARRMELRVSSTTSPDPPRTLLGDREGPIAQLMPCDWSPDNRQLLAAIRHGAALQLVLIDIQSGAWRVVKNGYWGDRPRAVFSRDGRAIAASMGSRPEALEPDIFVFRTDGGPDAEPAAIADPGQDVVAGWSPDGMDLVFFSDRGGARGLWQVRVVDGRVVGDPVLVRPESSGSPLGIVDSGALLVAASVSNRDVYLASVDFASGRTLLSPTRPVSRYVGSQRSPTFSPDGRTLAYLSVRRGLESGNYLVLQSLADGTTREIRLSVNPLLMVSWTPDGTAILGIGKHAAMGGAAYRIDVTTGETSVLLAESVAFPQFSPDATKLYFVRPASKPPLELVERDLASGTERVLLRNPAAMSPRISPDGTRIAVVIQDQPGFEATRTLRIVPVDGSMATNLIRSRDLAMVVRWTSDGDKLVTSNAGRLAVVPAGGGPPTLLDLAIAPPPQREEHLDLHPDGKRLVYMAGDTRTELWSLENLFPATAKK